jgi:alpha-tubulin suppressor-like RCC1 family protein
MGDNSLCPLTTVPFSNTIPTKIFSDVVAFGVGPDSFRTFAIKSDRSLWGWGWTKGGLGLPEASLLLSCDPRRILDNVEQVAMGSEHTLALVRSDPVTNGGKALQLMGWGSNECWQLGDYDLGNQTTPVPINPWKDGKNADDSIRNDPSIVKVAAAGIASFALMKDGTIWGWGDLSDSVVCDPWRWGDPEDPEARRLEGMDNVKDISAGPIGVLALRADGTLWGNYWNTGTSFKAEKFIRTKHDAWAFILDNVQEMSAGSYHGIALKKDGKVWAWGNNGSGQLGRVAKSIHTTPVQVMFPPPEETVIQLKKFREKMKAGKEPFDCIE